MISRCQLKCWLFIQAYTAPLSFISKLSPGTAPDDWDNSSPTLINCPNTLAPHPEWGHTLSPTPPNICSSRLYQSFIHAWAYNSVDGLDPSTAWMGMVVHTCNSSPWDVETGRVVRSSKPFLATQWIRVQSGIQQTLSQTEKAKYLILPNYSFLWGGAC